MSSIEAVSKTIIWTDINYLGLNDKWVAELVADGYTLIDRRTGKPKINAEDH